MPEPLAGLPEFVQDAHSTAGTLRGNQFQITVLAGCRQIFANLESTSNSPLYSLQKKIYVSLSWILQPQVSQKKCPMCHSCNLPTVIPPLFYGNSHLLSGPQCSFIFDRFVAVSTTIHSLFTICGNDYSTTLR